MLSQTQALAPAPSFRRWRIHLLLGAAVLIMMGLVAHHVLNLDAVVGARATLHRWTQDGGWRAALIYVALYGLLVAFAVPTASVLTLTGGLLFGGLIGGLLAMVAIVLGGSALFLAARGVLRGRLEAWGGTRLQRFRAGFEHDSIAWLLWLRLTPVVPFWLVNLALAALSLSFWRFLWTTCIGIAPLTMIYALAGAQLDRLIADRDALGATCNQGITALCGTPIGWGDIVPWQTMALFIALAGLSLLPVALRRLRPHKATL